MPRQFRKEKPYIVVFCEGKSEQAYVDFLKMKFQTQASIKRCSTAGLFHEAVDKFNKDKRYRNFIEVTDEIWFFFDVEEKDIHSLSERQSIINKLRKLRKKGGIRVRLLMTSGCIEYWLLLHYEKYSAPVRIVAEKRNVLIRLRKYKPKYKKGDFQITGEIAENYPLAVNRAKEVFNELKKYDIPSFEDCDERNNWLCEHCYTFSTVFEAIEFLEGIDPSFRNRKKL